MKIKNLAIFTSLALVICICIGIAAIGISNIGGTKAKVNIIEVNTPRDQITTFPPSTTVSVTSTLSVTTTTTITSSPTVSTTVDTSLNPYNDFKNTYTWSTPVESSFTWTTCGAGTVTLNGMVTDTGFLPAQSNGQSIITQQLIKSGWYADVCNNYTVGNKTYSGYLKSGRKILLVNETDSNTAEIQVNNIKYTIYYN